MERRPSPADTPVPAPGGAVDVDRLASSIVELLETDLRSEALVRFMRLRPPDQADILLNLTPGLLVVMLDLLPHEAVGLIVEELEPDEAARISLAMPDDRLPLVLDETGPEVAADVLRALPRDVAMQALGVMRESAEVGPLLGYEDDDAGGLMPPDFIALYDDMSISQATAFVRRLGRDLDPKDVSYLFAVDRDGVLKGGMSLAEMVLAQPHQRVSLLMQRDIFSVGTDTDQEQCAKLMERYNLQSLPVIDEAGSLVGVLKLEDMLGVLRDEATEDMYRMIGVDEEEKALGPFWRSVRGRLPWLVVNLGTAVLAGLVVVAFESTLQRAVILAAFLPIVAGQAGIAGTQTLTVIVRSIALGEVTGASTARLLSKEIGLGLVHGLAVAVLVGAIAVVWTESFYLGVVVAVAMMLSMVVSGVSGVLVPLGFKALRVDPALSSAVAVTATTDIVGFLVYLGLAWAAIGPITRTL